MSNLDNIIYLDASTQPPLSDDIMKILNSKFIENLRQQRNQLLVESDKYLLPDYPITSNNLSLMKQYRQALRDYMNLPEVMNYSYSCNIQLPDLPKFPF